MHVVFLRGANVGGNNVFRPARLAAELSHLGVVNIGAAGTFVVRERASAAAIRREVLGKLSFEPNIAIRPARDILALVNARPFAGVTFSKDVRGWVSAFCGKPTLRPRLPLAVEKGGAWVLRIERVEGAFALGLWQRVQNGFTIPANVVEDVMGVPATVRWWETYERIAKVIETRT